MSIQASPKQRLVSLDQFRGYTIAGMDMVNFIGRFVVTPYLFKHHNTFCSYADTIMPHFLFAVGFSFRLSFGRRALAQAKSASYIRVLRRLVGLLLIALFVFQFDGRLLPTYWIDLVSRRAWSELWRPFEKNWTQTLFQIALATLWIVPVIRLRARWRLAYLVGSAALHVFVNHWFYFHWMLASPVQGHVGGPLGFLTWSIPTLVGSLACDMVVDAPAGKHLRRSFAAAIGLMALGWVMTCGTRWYDVEPEPAIGAQASFIAQHPIVPDRDSFSRWRAKLQRGQWSAVLAEPPFVMPPEPRLRNWNYWMMSVKMGTLSFMTFNAGLSLFVYLIFYMVCDGYGWQLGVFRTLGRNSLAGYLLQWPLADSFVVVVEQTSTWWGPSLGFPPDDIGRNAPAIFVAAALVLYLFANWFVLRVMEKKGIFLKV